ncbi:unnamed protein product [Leuciscus chuanchicus]
MKQLMCAPSHQLVEVSLMMAVMIWVDIMWTTLKIQAWMLRLRNCDLTDEGCSALTSALRSNPEHLRELNLSENKIGKSVNLLSDVLQNPHCKLEKLELRYCDLSDEGFAALTSALRSNPEHLRYLDLTGNKIGKSVNLLSDVLQNPHCKLEKLELGYCDLTDEGFAALTSALRSNPEHLRELDLSGNKLGNSVNLLSDVLQNPHCKLELLWLNYCDLTDEGFAALTSALRSNPEHLRELGLFGNKIGHSGVKCLSKLTDLKNDPHYKLEILLYYWYNGRSGITPNFHQMRNGCGTAPLRDSSVFRRPSIPTRIASVLGQVIDISKSVVNMMASKVEVVMMKAEPITWVWLDTPPPKPQPTNEKKEDQDQEKMIA